METPSPALFTRPKFRQLLAILVLLWLGIVVIAVLSESIAWLSLDFTAPITAPIIYLVLFGGSSLWLVGQYRRQGINLKSLIGVLPNPLPWRAVVGLWITLFIFSMGSFQVSYTALSFVWPKYVETTLQQSIFLGAEEVSAPWIYNTLFMGVLVIGAPVLEEFLFRGFLLHRWGTRWNLSVAVILSSILFGFLHSNAIGLSAFGLVMALLYLRSRSLGLVIGVHSLNNAIAAGLEIVTRLSGGELTPSLEAFRAHWWIGGGMLLLSTPFLVKFIQQNWCFTQAALPYFIQRDRPS
ncbi:MAG: CPBP family intramembrane metalloprotease [Leptolyngbya sp. SIO1D8]|nr:CPBP family intramembrane metalloprotease [Leptolyngbya sp. SIO1D8]